MGKKRDAIIADLATAIHDVCEQSLSEFDSHIPVEVEGRLRFIRRVAHSIHIGLTGEPIPELEQDCPEDQGIDVDTMFSAEPDAIVPISKEGREAFEQLLDAIGGDNCQCHACQARRAAETPPEKKH